MYIYISLSLSLSLYIYIYIVRAFCVLIDSFTRMCVCGVVFA